nr:NAD(P)H-binding protein [Gammaproteobacteria bacterium]NIW45453.1 NAD(P)H-binding protein [Gammaproteobacteria bacterium]NIX00931.1 NAD(P)H-binding protein [Phycisphaerae bacterium]
MNSGQLHVVFGTGPAGMAVIEELLSHGENVRAVNRSGKAELPGDVEAVSGNATNVDDTRKICQDASVVYNCTNAPYHKW